MRNLKKFLALVMAMVMAFSLMLTANAASKYDQVKEWTDKDQVTEAFVEAVDVLSGMKIFQGDDRGFAPGDTITRAEVSALIYRIATGDVTDSKAGLYANYGNFADVNEGDWFAGYVGYCANAGYIKGTTPTTFNPYAPVTGYEALAMALRAVGYDKNGEFTGATWQTNVSALGTRLGVLNDVKTTSYNNTLHLASRRDVVASIIFNAITGPKLVTYTPALGYETDRFTSDDLNTLGGKIFGLKYQFGIIVGNQDTGESATRVNWAGQDADKKDYPSFVSYFHQTNNWLGTGDKAVETTKTLQIDAKTGIEMFGHRVKVWYGGFSTVKETYTLYDKVVKTALVTTDPGANSAKLSDSTNAADALLGKAAVDAGFSVNLSSSKAVFNQDFGVSGGSCDATTGTDIDYVQNGADAKAGSANYTTGVVSNSKWGNDEGNDKNRPLYLLISNNDANTVDMVVAVNAVVSKVSQVNNYATTPTVTVPVVNHAASHQDWNDKNRAMIDQKALTATSDKDLNNKVVGVAIIGTNTADVNAVCTSLVGGNSTPEAAGFIPASNSLTALGGTNTVNYFYRLSQPTEYVEGVVTGYNHNARLSGDEDATSGSITVNGQEIKRSLLADAIVGYDASKDSYSEDYKDGNGLARGLGGGNVGLSPDTGDYGTYRVYLDSEGKYIWAEPIVNSDFIYGTYVDYQTAYASSTYEYTMVGVNLQGEQVKRVVKTVDTETINGARYSVQRQGLGQLGVPFRDTTGNVASATPGSYTGFTITENGDLTSISSSTATPRVLKGSPNVYQGTDIVAADLTINTDEAKLGMKVTQAATKYFTNETKFIVVEGAGTDTQKVEIYTGMVELLGGASQVAIDADRLSTNKGFVFGNGSTDNDSDELNKQMYYTTSALTYASVYGNQNLKVDTIILPKAALTWTGRTDLVYIGNKEANSISYVGTTPVYLYTVYQNGEARQLWIDSASKDSQIRDHDQFYQLGATDKKMPTGETIYRVGYVTPKYETVTNRPDTTAIVNPANPVIEKAAYWAATYDSQTATINAGTGDLNSMASMSGKSAGKGIGTNAAAAVAGYNVAGAKVVNLNNTGANKIWPGIADLGSLNDAASTAVNYTDAKLPLVSCLVDPAEPMNVLVIYVCYNQT